MSKSLQSSVSDATKRKNSLRKLKKSSLTHGLNDGFKEAFFLTCLEMDMKVIPNVRTLTSEPQSWTSQLDNISDKDRDVRPSFAKTHSAPVRKLSKQTSEGSVADQELLLSTDHSKEIIIVYGTSPRSTINMAICKHFRMSDHILGAFQRTLIKFQTLKTLRLEFCQLSTEQLKGVKYLLVQNPNIIDLSLNGNTVSKQPYHILLKDTQLLHLSLKFCKMTDRGIAKLAQPLSLISPQTLLSLNLSSNLITDIGAKHLADALRTNRTLTHLSLVDNYITDKGCADLMAVLKKFTLKHEEVVLRRHKNLHFLLIKGEIMKDFMKTKRSECSLQYYNNNVTVKRSSSSARIRSGKDKSSVSSFASQRRRSSADSKTIASLIESKLPKDPHPFMHECTAENQEVFCRGNFRLSFLNLSYNKITDDGLTIIKDTLREQQFTKATDDSITGLSKILLEGNDIKFVEGISSITSVNSSESRLSTKNNTRERKSLVNKIIL